jgi:hypothetical protein
MATLDRILVSTQWEAKYPLARVTNLPRRVSDHNPLLVNLGIEIRLNHILLDLKNGGVRLVSLKIWLRDGGILNVPTLTL